MVTFIVVFVWFFLLKIDFFHILYSDYGCPSPNSPQFFPASFPVHIHTLSVSDNSNLWMKIEVSKIKQKQKGSE